MNSSKKNLAVFVAKAMCIPLYMVVSVPLFILMVMGIVLRNKRRFYGSTRKYNG